MKTLSFLSLLALLGIVGGVECGGPCWMMLLCVPLLILFAWATRPGRML